MKRTIYKFFRINEYLYDTLISNQLYFSSIKQFNDPYDCHLVFPDKISKSDFKSYLEKNEIEEEKSIKLLSQFEKQAQVVMNLFFDTWREMLNYSGLCCFSKTKENLLLWSHYADSHRGVSLGFDYDIITSQYLQFDEVVYDNTPIFLDINDVDKSITDATLRKSKNWEYEEEIRFLMERSKNVGFNQDALVEVNFGSRCSKRNMLNIHYLINKLGYTKCKFYETEIDKSKYSIIFKQINFDLLKAEVLENSNEKRFSKAIDLRTLDDL